MYRYRLWLRVPSRYRAAVHELRCRECRVSWGGWLGRLTGRQA